MTLRSLRFLQSLALLTISSSCAPVLNTGDSSSDARSGEAATDGAASDALDESLPFNDGAGWTNDAMMSIDPDVAAVDGSITDAMSVDVALGTCADEAGAPVDAPAVGDAGGACSALVGRACAAPGLIACGGIGGASSFGCVCRAQPCADGSGSALLWICGGGGALPPPELAAA